MKFLTLLFSFFIVIIGSQAQFYTPKGNNAQNSKQQQANPSKTIDNNNSVTPPSLTFNPNDSFFIVVENEQKFILHKVKAGESPNLIKKFYGIELGDLYYSNPDITGSALRAGQVLRIPIINRAIRTQAGIGFNPALYYPLYYKVKEKETLYRIAKVYFKTAIETFQTNNRLISDVVQKDQILKVGWIYKTGIPDSLRRQNGVTGSLSAENQQLKLIYEEQKADKKEQRYDGTACWMKGEKFATNDKLHVLYTGLAAGTIIKIENPMFPKNYVYAQVVADLPDNSLTEGAMILLSANTAFALGAVDARFPIRVYHLK
jgi:LysM domain